MFKRITLFLLTNLAVLVLLRIVMAVFGIDPANNAGLLVFAALFGFGGALVSLLMSKWTAKRFTGAQVITQPRGELEQWLLATVQRQARDAGIEIVSQDLPAGDASPCPAPVLLKPAIKFLDHRDEARVLFLPLGPFTNIET